MKITINGVKLEVPHDNLFFIRKSGHWHFYAINDFVFIERNAKDSPLFRSWLPIIAAVAAIWFRQEFNTLYTKNHPVFSPEVSNRLKELDSVIAAWEKFTVKPHA